MIPIPREVVAWAQRQLGETDDGMIGPDTHGALMGWAYGREADLPDFWPDLPAERLMACFLQAEARDAGRDPGPVDGWWGARTEHAIGIVMGAVHPGWRDLVDAAQPERRPAMAARPAACSLALRSASWSRTAGMPTARALAAPGRWRPAPTATGAAATGPTASSGSGRFSDHLNHGGLISWP
ncbi:hypothetical protein [Mangrovicoccus ximenensis]|uniref:hypothetical protein n=1 Tax=Mangrovicoccus ximenensis TaxID=1911570 RepID=UPI000D3D526B|nr:hypothetical protein [Mangrovicoccus ximenensis]